MSHSKENDEFYLLQGRHFRQCLREAWLVIGIWTVGLVWCSTAIITWGYVPVEDRPAEPELILGIPSWVVWGLFVPWFAMTLATWWFAGVFLKDDEPYMEFPVEDPEEEPLSEP